MELSTLEKIVSDSRMSAVKKVESMNKPGVDILIADGYFPRGHSDNKKPHYRTVWVVARDRMMDFGCPMYFEGGVGCCTQEHRIGKAILDAEIMINDLKKVGFYDRN